MEAAGLGPNFLYSGIHSVGLIEFEPPRIFGPSSTATLEEDMVVSVDIPVFNAPWGGLRVEDGFLVTATGAERLDDTPYLLTDRRPPGHAERQGWRRGRGRSAC